MLGGPRIGQRPGGDDHRTVAMQDGAVDHHRVDPVEPPQGRGVQDQHAQTGQAAGQGVRERVPGCARRSRRSDEDCPPGGVQASGGGQEPAGGEQ
jgi:hypothetical protein